MDRKPERGQAGNEVEKGRIQMVRGKVTIFKRSVQKPWRIMIEHAEIGARRGKMVETRDRIRRRARRHQGVKEGGAAAVGVKEGRPVCKVWRVQGAGRSRGCLQIRSERNGDQILQILKKKITHSRIGDGR